jgi:hypothetical protein
MMGKLSQVALNGVVAHAKLRRDFFLSAIFSSSALQAPLDAVHAQYLARAASSAATLPRPALTRSRYAYATIRTLTLTKQRGHGVAPRWPLTPAPLEPMRTGNELKGRQAR